MARYAYSTEGTAGPSSTYTARRAHTHLAVHQAVPSCIQDRQNGAHDVGAHLQRSQQPELEDSTRLGVYVFPRGSQGEGIPVECRRQKLTTWSQGKGT